MELYKEILSRVLERETVCVTFPELSIDPKEIVALESYQALQKIKAIIEDDEIDDPECFRRIERIVCVLEELGSNGGNRHDFG